MKAKFEIQFDDDLEVAEVLGFLLTKIVENNPIDIPDDDDNAEVEK